MNIEILRGVSWEIGWGWVCKTESLVVCGVSWDVGTGWVGSHAWCNMASCSGKVQNRDAWDENLRRIWGFVVYLWNVGSGLAHMRGVICSGLLRQSSKQGCVRWTKIGSEICSVSWDVGSGWVGSNAWCNMESCSGKVQNRDVWDENLRVWGFVVYLWNVGSGLAHMRGVIWRAAPAKFKRGMCEMKILGSEVLGCVFGTLVQGWHTCVV